MSCLLPPEILDLIIDQLHNEPTTLRACCLVSKSWIPRTRKHLFAHVEFDAEELTFISWMKTFPDPSNSPAHHTRILTVCRPASATDTATDTDVTSCARTFHNVVHLHYRCSFWADHKTRLVPFYGFSHTVRSLRLTHTSFEVFDLVCSFPLLEDLALVSLRLVADIVGWTAPSTSPKLTGSLELSTSDGFHIAIRRLLDFPDGLHFVEITALCFYGDFESMADLVSRCSGTLEYFSLCCFLPGMSLDFSKAAKLRDLMFRCRMPYIRWIAMALGTVESKNLQQITIHLYPATIGGPPKRRDRQECQDLDRVLVQFWNSHSIRPRFLYALEDRDGEKVMRDRISGLFPELTRRGLVDVVAQTSPSL